MICLDTNYLIGGITQGSAESKELIAWTKAGEALIAPMPAWYEFLCGPVTNVQIATLRAFLEKIVPFGESQAIEAARIFNATGRKRSLRVDCMIAATAMQEAAQLATNNRSDFKPFVPLGLQLI